MRRWLVNQSILILVMNPRITCPPSGDCSESLSYIIFQEFGGRIISAVNLSLKVGGGHADGQALLTLAGRSNLGKETMGGTQQGSFRITQVFCVTTETAEISKIKDFSTKNWVAWERTEDEEEVNLIPMAFGKQLSESDLSC